MAKEFNGTTKNVLTGVVSSLIVGSVLGLAVLWKTSVSAAEVSRQIEQEAPAAMADITKEFKADVNDIRRELMGHRIMLERIDQNVQHIRNP